MTKNLISAICLIIILINIASGQTWDPVPTQKNAFKDVKDITINNVDPANTPATMYAADGIKHIKSTDNGISWNPTTWQYSPLITASKYDNPQIVLAGNSSYFERSNDGGTNWNTPTFYRWDGTISTNNNKPLVAAFYTNPINTNWVLIGRQYFGAYEKMLAFSTDGGATFRNYTYPALSYSISAIAPNIASNGNQDPYAIASFGLSGTGILFCDNPSSNTSTTWIRKSSYNYANYFSALALYTRSNNPDAFTRIYAGTTNGKVYWTDTWASSNLTLEKDFTNNGTTNCGAIRSIRIVMLTSSTYDIYVTTDFAVYKKPSGGSWTVYSNLLDTKTSYITISPVNPNYMFFGSKGFIYRTTNGGTAWSTSSSVFTRYFPISSVGDSSSYIFTVSNDLSIANGTTDRYGTNTIKRIGLNAEDDFIGKYAQVITKSPTTRNILVCGTLNGGQALWYSQDDGQNYSPVSQLQSPYLGTSCEGIARDPKKPEKIFVYGKLKSGSNDQSICYNTQNGDPTQWLNWAVFTDSTILTLAPLGDGDATNGSAYVYAGSNGAGLWRSPSSGINNTWGIFTTTSLTPNLTSTTTIKTIAVNPNIPGITYVGGSGALWKFTNANTPTPTVTVQTTSITPKRIIIDPRFTDPSFNSQYLIIVSDNDKVYRSSNGGVSFTEITGSIPIGTTIYDLRTDPSDNSIVYIATSNGLNKAILLNAPTLSYPSSNASILWCPAPTLTWNPVNGATSYGIQISLNRDMSNPRVNTTTSSTSYPFSDSCNTKYYWKVYALSNGFGDGPWSKVDSFTTNQAPPAPTPVAPVNNITFVDSCSPVSFSWQGVCSASSYRLQVDTSVNFNSTLLQDTTVYATTCGRILNSGPDHGNGNKYYWRIASRLCDGTQGAWSTPLDSLTILPAPRPSTTAYTPLNNATNASYCDTIQFKWSVAIDPSYFYGYFLEISADPTFNTGTITNGLLDTSYTLPANTLNSNTVYYWRVYTFNFCNNKLSAYSTVWNFKTAYPYTYIPFNTVISSPSYGSTNICINPTFNFSTLKYAIKHRLQISTDPTFLTITREVVVYYSATSYYYTTPYLSQNTVYYWRARGENCFGAAEWSDTWPFTTGTSTCSGGPKIAINPNHIEIQKPTNFQLAQNYPNPFNPTTRFDYALPQDARVSLKVYNTLGQVVATLVDEFQSVGFKTVEFDASRLPSGIYFYRLCAGDFTDIKKMILMK